MTRQTAAPLNHLSLAATNRPADFFVRSVESGDMLLDAPYQRGSVWTEDQQIALVRSWLSGVPIPAVILNDRTLWGRRQDAGGYAYAVIDGKQRILTAIAWFSGALAVPASWFPEGYVETTEDTDDGPYVRFTGLTVVGCRFMAHRCVLPCAEGQLATVEQEAEVYLLVNGGGTPQTGADMANAMRVAQGQPRTHPPVSVPSIRGAAGGSPEWMIQDCLSWTESREARGWQFTSGQAAWRNYLDYLETHVRHHPPTATA